MDKLCSLRTPRHVRADTDILIYLISESSSKNCGHNKANTQAKIGKATHSGAEVICLRKKIWRIQWINSGT